MNKQNLLSLFFLLAGTLLTLNTSAQGGCDLTVTYIGYGEPIFPSPLSGMCLPQNTVNIEITYSEEFGDSLKVNEARVAATGSPQVVQLMNIPQELIVEVIGTNCFRFLDVELPPLPPAPVMVEGDTIYCAGETLAPMHLSGYPNSTFYWTNRDGTCIQSLFFSGQYNEEWTYPHYGEFSVYQYIDGVATEPLYITIKEGIPVEITGEFDFCEGDDVRLNVLVGGQLPNAIHDITWLTPIGDVTDVTSIAADVEYWYTVEVRDDKGCKGVASIFVEEHPLPEVEITSSASFCEGTSIKLEAQGVGADNGNTYGYIWQNPKGDYYSGSIIEATMVGDYTVTVTNNNGCSIIESILVEEDEDCTGGGGEGFVSTENPEDSDAFNLYPNPNYGTFRIEFPNVTTRQLTVFNLSGQAIYQIEYTQKIVDIDVRHLSLATGIYMIQVQEDGLTTNQKVVIGN